MTTPVLILVPPSERKAAPIEGPALRMDDLSFDTLRPTRSAVLDALTDLCSGDADKAAEVLGLPAGRTGEVARDRVLRSAPTLPAGRLYTGVLYEALDLPGMTGPAARRAADAVLICSALWGLLRIGDRIPPYRLAMSVRLPGVGALAAAWRPALARLLPELADGRLIVDLRSSGYAAAWRPPPDIARRTVAVRVLRETIVAGERRRTVVSHMAKATRGALAGALLRSPLDPATPAELADALTTLGYRVELTAGSRSPARLDVIHSDVRR